MNKTNILNGWFICLCLLFLFLFVSIFLHTVFTSSADTKFTLFREVSITHGPVPSYHLPPRTSGTGNFRHHLPGWISGQLEWDNIPHPGLCVVRPSSCLCNQWITGHLEWEHIRRPGIYLYVLLQDRLDIISASWWNQPSTRKSMKVLPLNFCSAPSPPPPSDSASNEQPHSPEGDVHSITSLGDKGLDWGICAALTCSFIRWTASTTATRNWERGEGGG